MSSIRKTAEHNAQHRRRLAARLFGGASGVVVVLAGAATIAIGGVSLPAFGSGSGGSSASEEPDDIPDVVLDDVEWEPVGVEPGRTTFRGDVADTVGSVTMPVEVGGREGSSGLMSLVVGFEDPSFEGVLTVEGEQYELSRGGVELFLNVEAGRVALVVERTNGVVTEMSVRAEHP